MKIRVLGSGCKTCKKLFETVSIVVKEKGINADVKYVTDMAEIAKSGVMSMPALEVDGVVKVSGKALNKTEVAKIIGSNFA